MRNIYRILVSFIQVFLNNWTIVAEELSTKGAEGILEITENVGDNCATGYGTIELYALTKPDYLSNYAGVALGARYGNDGGDYLSGRFNDKPLRSEGLSDYPIDEARRRFAALLAK
jgi:hypothetical protein